MKYDQKHNAGTGRERDARPVCAWNYDNNDTDECNRAFGAVTVYQSEDNFFRAGDSYDSVFTRWWHDREKVECAAKIRARLLSGHGGSVEYEEL